MRSSAEAQSKSIGDSLGSSAEGPIVYTDGTLSPCFDMIGYDHDWGRIWEPRFQEEELLALKEKCLPSCSSTCFYTMGSYYNLYNLPEWIRKHTRVG